MNNDDRQTLLWAAISVSPWLIVLLTVKLLATLLR